MYLTLSQPRLRQALTQVSHVAAQKTSVLPILTQAVFTATPGLLEITASNGEQGIHVRLEAEVDAPGQALLPARLLTDFVRDLPDAPLTLALPAPTDPTSALLRCGQARATIKQTAFPVEEFPQVAHLETGMADELLALDGELLREMIRQVCFAAATDASRPVLTGVHLDIRAGQATFAAADAFRLATRTLQIADQQRTGSWIIPARALIELARLLPAESSVQVLLTGQGKHLLFHTPHLDLVSPLLEGTYPDIRRAIPAQIVTRVMVPTQAFVAAARLMQPFGANQVRISLTRQNASGFLVLEMTAPDVGTTDMRLPVSLSGPEQSLLLHLPYLTEALAAIPTSEVCLELGGERNPLVLKPAGSLDALHVIMPLQVASSPLPPAATHTTPASSSVTVH